MKCNLRLLILSCLFFFPFAELSYVSSSNVFSKYGGSLILSTTSDPRSFNDIIAKETSTTLVTNYIFEGLTTTNAHTLKVEPNLAKSWVVSPEGTVWDFHLRDDVLWNDGVKFTSDDVVFTFNDLIYNPRIPSSARDVFTVEGKEFKVEKLDDFTVRFTLPIKFAPFLRGMSQAILPRHKLEKAVKDNNFNHTWGIDTSEAEIVGTGPFKLSKYLPGQHIVFERNKLYWKKSNEQEKLPFLDKIIYLIVQNADIEILKFLEGETDAVMLRGLDYSLLKPLEYEKNFTVFDLGPDTGSSFLTFNLNKRLNPQSGKPYVDPVKSGWFCDRNFREAVAHAIDYDQIIKIVKNGLGYRQYSPLSPAVGFYYNDKVEKRNYDQEKAKEFLEKGGYRDRDGDGILEDKGGNKIEFNLYTNSGNTERVDIAAIISQDLSNLGMKINFQALEFNTVVGKLNSSFDWDSVILGLTGVIDPHFEKNVWMSSGGLHLWNPNQEEPATEWERKIDDIFVKGVQELDEAKRKIFYDKYQVIASKEIPLIYTALGAKISAVRNKFGNLYPTNYGGVFHNIEEIYIKR
ncbi:MAG: ABC transporter substrate-binding protein [Candidatus Omnitrophica bacterium]|nr:ABC transporter substrate-binding protein [Candidatus Omnitrophota bacterium]